MGEFRKSLTLHLGKEKFEEMYDTKNSKILNQLNESGIKKSIFTVKNKESGDTFVAYKSQFNGLQFKSSFWNQIEALMKIKDVQNLDNIIQYFDCFQYENENYWCIIMIMEQADTSLWDYAQSNIYDQKNLYHFFQQTLKGLKILQDHNIYPGDIKPSKILIQKGKIKLFDFKKAFISEKNTVQVWDRLGTEFYMDPNLLFLERNQETFKYEYDIDKSTLYSLGISFLEVGLQWKLQDCLSFQSEVENLYRSKQFDEYDQKISDALQKIDDIEFRKILKNILNLKNQNRWDMRQCLQHCFGNMYIEELEESKVQEVKEEEEKKQEQEKELEKRIEELEKQVKLYQNIEQQNLKIIDEGKFDQTTKQYLGKGGFGWVYSIRYREEREDGNNLIAYKQMQIPIEDIDGDDVHFYITEIINLSKTPNHININQAKGYSISKEQKTVYCKIYFDLANQKDMYHFLTSRESCFNGMTANEKKAVQFELAFGIIEGLQSCHLCNIVHLDLKPQNVLVHQEENGKFVAKIADFGISKQIRNTIRSIRTGISMRYMPKEFGGVEDSEVTVSKKTDIWSVGCLLLFIFSQRKPYEKAETDGISRAYIVDERPFQNYLEQDTLEKIQPIYHILEKCFNHNYKTRPSLQEIYNMLKIVQQQQILIE